jgi:hypothetical protein
MVLKPPGQLPSCVIERYAKLDRGTAIAYEALQVLAAYEF